MRNIIVSEFITLNGVIEGPGPIDSFPLAGWGMPYASEDLMKFKYDELFAADALLLGRVTYEGFAAAWPTMTEAGDFGERMNGISKYIVSKTLQDPSWNNSTVISGTIKESIAALKQQPGKDILVFGSSVLTQSLMEYNLIDEYRLLVYPVVLGSGKRLFKDGSKATLALKETREFSTGVVLLRYTRGK